MDRPGASRGRGLTARISPALNNARSIYAMQETQVPALGQEDPLEKGMATHCSILAWRIPGTEEENLGAGAPLAGQWLGFLAPTAGGTGQIPGWGSITHAVWDMAKRV